MRLPHPRGPWVCGHGARCQGNCHMQQACLHGVGWERGHTGCFLWESGWPGDCLRGPLGASRDYAWEDL